MKKLKIYGIILLISVLLLSVFTGCSNDDGEVGENTTALNIKVIDKETGEAVEGVTISREKQIFFIDFTVVTDEEGKASLTVKQNTQYTFNILKDNYYNIYGYTVTMGEREKELTLELIESIPEENSFDVDTSDQETLNNIGTEQTSINIEDQEVKEKLNSNGVRKIKMQEADESEVEEVNSLLEAGERTLGSFVSFSFLTGNSLQTIKTQNIDPGEFSGFIEAAVSLEMLSINLRTTPLAKYNMLVIIKNSMGTGRFRQPVLSTDGEFLYALIPSIYKGELADSITVFLTYKADREETEDRQVIESVAELDNIEVNYGTKLTSITLPARISVTSDDGYKVKVPVIWDKNNAEPSYNPEKPGEYLFSGELDLTELDNLTNPDGLTPSVIVKVGEPPNRAPVLEEIGNKSINETEKLKFTVNAEDVDGDSLTYNATGDKSEYFDPESKTFSWTPTHEDSGSYELTFTVSDGELSDSETIMLTVTDVDRPPMLAEIGDKEMAENSELIFTVTASDPDGDPVTLSTDGLPEGAEFNQETGYFSWTPDYDQSGEYNILFKADAGGLSDTEEIVIIVNEVNRPPEAADDKVITDEDTPVTINPEDLMTNDRDLDDDTLTVTVSTNPENGSLVDNDTGSYVYTPDPDFNGTDSFTYTLSDGRGGTDTAEVVITVNSVNDKPVLEEIGNKRIKERETLKFTLSGSDVDGDELTYSASGEKDDNFDPENRQFSWTPSYRDSGSYELTFTVSDGELSDSETITISVGNVNRPPVLRGTEDKEVDEGKELTFNITAYDPDGDPVTLTADGLPEGVEFNPDTGDFSWIPDYDQSGEYNIMFTADAGGLSDTKEMVITVNEVNRPPEAGDVEVTTDEDTALVINSQEIKSNDSDPDGDILTTSISAEPENGSIEEIEGGSFVYTPNTDFNGTDSFTYTLSDGRGGSDTAEVVITVNPVNDKPILKEIGNKSIKENETLRFSLSASDVDGDELNYSASGERTDNFDPEDGQFSWTPTYEDSGSYELTFTVNDGKLYDSKTITITVIDVNRAPVFEEIGDKEVDEGIELTFKVEASDPDGDEVTLTAEGLPEGAEFNTETGDFKWTPGYQQAGSYEVVFRTTDSEESMEKTVNIVVNPSNAAPVIESISGVSEGKVTTAEKNQLNLTVTAADPDGDELSYNITGDIADKFTQDGNQFSWEPTYADAGIYNITLEVSDGQETTARDVEITVEETPEPGSISGQISLDSGSVNQDVTVEVSTGGKAVTVTIPNGEDSTIYEISRLLPGDYNLRAIVTENAVGNYEITNNEQDNVTVQEGSTTGNINFTLGSFSQGDGSAANPFRILDWNDLSDIRNNLDKHFILKTDLDSSSAGYSYNWIPIGDADNKFTGSLDGNGHVIKNLKISRRYETNIGLYGCIGTGAEISNLGLEGVNITGERYVGGLVSINEGEINRCYVTGYVKGYIDEDNVMTSHAVGGLVGKNAGSINESYAAGTVSGHEIDNYTAHTWTYTGGLVGYNRSGTIDNSYAAVDIGGYSAGGLVGQNGVSVTNTSITNCYAVGKLTATYSKGLVDGYSYGTVTNSFYDRDTTGQSDTGQGHPVHTAGMTYVSTFDWSFGSTWSIDEGRTYPWLTWQRRPGGHNYPPDFGSIRGTIQLEGDPAIQDINIELDVFGEKTNITLTEGSNSVVYEINDLRPRKYTVSARITGTAEGVYEIRNSNQSNITVRENMTTDDVNFTAELIPVYSSISGTIGLKQGIVNRDVDLEITTGDKTITATIPAGNSSTSYSIEELWPGDYNITARVTGAAEGYFEVITGEQTVPVNENEQIEGINFDLAKFAGGSGTAAAPYQINNWYQLDNVRYELDKYFVLNTDLDNNTPGYSGLAGYNARSGKGWKPIGEDGNNPFTGNFDGNECIIKDLNIDRENENYIGLFGAIEGAEINYLGLEDVNIEGNQYVGSIAGLIMAGTASESYAAGSVSGEQKVGGFAGENGNGTIRDSYSAVYVYGHSDVGGLVGYNKSDIEKCYSVRTVTGFNDKGGLVGSNTGSISASFYNKETARQNDSGKGIPTTTFDMTDATTYTDWDIPGKWDIEPGETYPYLQWQGTADEHNKAPLPASISLTANPGDLYAGYKTTLTAIVRDESNRVLEGVPVYFNGGNGTWSRKIAITDKNGRAVVQYTAHADDVGSTVNLAAREEINNNSDSVSLDVTFEPQATITNIDIDAYQPYGLEDEARISVDFRGVAGDNVYVVVMHKETGRQVSYVEEFNTSGESKWIHLHYDQNFRLYEGDHLIVEVYEDFDTMVWPNELINKLTEKTSAAVPPPPTAKITDIGLEVGSKEVSVTVEFSGDVDGDNVYLQYHHQVYDSYRGWITPPLPGSPSHQVVEKSGDTVTIVSDKTFQHDDNVIVTVLEDTIYYNVLDKQARVAGHPFERN